MFGLRSGEWDCVVTGGVSELITPAELLAYEVMACCRRAAAWSPSTPALTACSSARRGPVHPQRVWSDARRDGDRHLRPHRGHRRSRWHYPGSSAPAAARARDHRDRHPRRLTPRPPSIPSPRRRGGCATRSACRRPTRREAMALMQVFAPRSPALAGSTKASVGHLRAAAGAAAPVRTALALHHRKPPAAAGAPGPAFWLARPGSCCCRCRWSGWPGHPGRTAARRRHRHLAGRAVLPRGHRRPRRRGSPAAARPQHHPAPRGQPRPPRRRWPSPAWAASSWGRRGRLLPGPAREGKDQVRDARPSRFRLRHLHSDKHERR